MIVFIDDNEEFRQAISEYTSRLGHTVKEFSTAEQALVAIEQEPESLELLITDIRLPGMSGLSLIKLVRSFKPQLSVVVISSYAHENHTESRTTRDAYTAFLKKPFALQSFGDKVSEALHWGQTGSNGSGASHDDDTQDAYDVA